MKKIFLLIIFLTFVSCDKIKNNIEPDEEISKSDDAATESYSPVSDNSTIVLKDNKSYSEIKTGAVKSVSIDQNILTSKSKGEKTKYLDKDGKVVYEIKYKEGGFKLREENGALLWKIKIQDGKIKISNNEENLNPFEIKFKDENALKIEKSDTKIGEVIRNPSSSIITSELNKALTFQSEKLTLAHGVIFLTEIPELQRFLIFTELNSK